MLLGVDGGGIWLGTDIGMSLLSPDGQWHHGLTGKVVLSFCECTDGTILAGTYGAGVYAVRPDGSSRLAYGTEKRNLTTNYVFSLFVDRAGSVWIGCLDGPLIELSAHGRREFDISQVQAITSSPSGHIAVGTANGLYLIDPTTHQYTRHFQGYAFEGTNVNSFIQAILFIDDNHVWLGTDGGGIYIYDIPNRQFQELTISQGLPSNYVYALEFDGLGRIWASTDKELVYLVPDKQPKVVNVNFIAGLEREYRRQSMTNLSDGTLIFGATNGAVIINPKLIGELNYKAPLRFHGISILGQEPLDSTLRHHLYTMLADKNMKLSYSQNSFDITFESINYPYQNDIIYEYQLEGSNPEWVRLGSSQTIHLTRLSSGNYQLHVRSISRNGGKVLDTQPAPTDNHAAGSSTATSSSTSTEDAIDTAGKEFVEQATQLILDNLQNSDFNVATLCMKMAMSRTLFYGKLKSYTGTAPQDFIRAIRLERAAALLRQGATVSETAAKTGFVNSKHFSTVFRKQFGTPPSQYQQQ